MKVNLVYGGQTSLGSTAVYANILVSQNSTMKSKKVTRHLEKQVKI